MNENGRGYLHGVPPGLVAASGWTWRLLVLAAGGYLLYRALALLAVVVLPLIGALLLTALLYPVTRLLRRRMPALAAAWLTLLLALLVLGGLGYFIGLQAVGSFPTLIDQLIATSRTLLGRLEQTQLLGQLRIERLQQAVIAWLQQNRQGLTNVLVAGARYLVEAATGIVLMVFITFFFLYEGDRFWSWVIVRLPVRAAVRINRSGQRAWDTVGGYVHGTIVIATIHGIVIGLTLALLGVPLVALLAVLVFVGSFIPIIGALVAGGVAVLITLGTEGLIDAAILAGVLVVENQLEGNLLQPLVMRRYVRLNPFVIGIVLVVGAVLFGIVGAVVAVPATSVLYRAVPVLVGRDSAEYAGGGQNGGDTGDTEDTGDTRQQ